MGIPHCVASAISGIIKKKKKKKLDLKQILILYYNRNSVCLKNNGITRCYSLNMHVVGNVDASSMYTYVELSVPHTTFRGKYFALLLIQNEPVNLCT